MSYNPELMQSLIDTQTAKIEETRKYISELLSLVENSSIKQQITASAVDSAAIASVVQQKISFRESVIKDTGCQLKAYMQAVKKACIRLRLEDVDIDLSQTKREILIEEYVSEHPDYLNEFEELVREEDSNLS